MGHVSTYLNFEGTTEAAFEFYKSVFGTDYIGGIMRHGDVPMPDDAPPMPDHVRNLVMNVQLPILGGHVLMATDMYEGMGQPFNAGNNFAIVLHPDSREDLDALYEKLSDGAEVGTRPHDAFWGDYYGDLRDKFGIQWSLAYSPPR